MSIQYFLMHIENSQMSTNVSATNYTYTQQDIPHNLQLKQMKKYNPQKSIYYPSPETSLSHSSFIKVLRKCTPLLVVCAPPRNSLHLK